MVVRAAKYRRVSSITSKDGASLETQDEDLNKRILEKGDSCDPAHNYEEVFTGTVWRERAILQQMLQAASRYEFDVLLIHHTDRLARTGTYVSYARKAEVTYSLDKAHKRYVNCPKRERLIRLLMDACHALCPHTRLDLISTEESKHFYKATGFRYVGEGLRKSYGE